MTAVSESERKPGGYDIGIVPVLCSLVAAAIGIGLFVSVSPFSARTPVVFIAPAALALAAVSLAVCSGLRVRITRDAVDVTFFLGFLRRSIPRRDIASARLAEKRPLSLGYRMWPGTTWYLIGVGKPVDLTLRDGTHVCFDSTAADAIVRTLTRV